jgi:hypothetical protein
MCHVKYFAFFLISMVMLCPAFGQKTIKKVFLSPHVTAIQINTALFFEVTVVTTKEKELVLEASLEGEYQKDLGIEVTENGNTLLVAGQFQPYFNPPNDKLSAHKVVSISLHVEVPENKEVFLYGGSANIQAEGNYKELKVVLNDGTCTFGDVGRKLSATTQSGPINLAIARGKIKATSKYGTVAKDMIPDGDTQYELSSTTGNITIKKAR